MISHTYQGPTVLMEVKSYGCCWLESEAGAAEVQKHILALQQEKGFEVSKMALSITVRCGAFAFAYFGHSRKLI